MQETPQTPQENTTKSQKALLAGPAQPQLPQAELIARVAKLHGVGPFKQLRHMIPRTRGKKAMMSSEYYDFGLYDPKYSRADRNAFVGVAMNRKLNETLTAKNQKDALDLIQTKLRFGQFLEENGLSTTRTQALYSPKEEYPGIQVLKSADDIAGFLRAGSTVYPLFGKPLHGTLSVGSALIANYDAAQDAVVLGNGEIHPVEAFAKEVFDDYAVGYMFQDAIQQHADMTAITGPSVGTLRIVTVQDENGPQVLYTLWKIPSPKAMSDNFWQVGSMLSHVDLETGQVVTCRRGKGPDAVDVAEHPVSKMPTIGFQMPHFEAAKELAKSGHAKFKTLGVIGWDMGIAEEGPVIVEANCNPYHTLYQIATGEGILHPRFASIFEKIKTYVAQV